MSPPSRILPQRAWAAAVPTLLSHDGLTKLLTASMLPGHTQFLPASPLERFFACIHLRRHMQRVIQSETPVSRRGEGSGVSLVGAAASIIFCRDKKYARFCCDKIMFVARNMFVRTNILSQQNLSRQAYFCHDKHLFVVSKHVFCRDKSMQYRYFCRGNSFVVTSILLLQHKTCFVTTNTCLSQQNFCYNKNDTGSSSSQ